MAEKGITILGTGGDSIVVGRQLRASGGFILNTEDSQIHIDPGPGTLLQMAKHDYHPRETTGIVLSHHHVNHSGDANALISAMTHNGIDKKGVLVGNAFDEGSVASHQKSIIERVIPLGHGHRVGINDVEIYTVELKHYDSQCNGYLFHTPQYVVGYISDTRYFEGLAEQFKEANILIINCKYPEGVEGGDHLNTEDVVKILEQISPQLTVLTHFGAKMLNADPLAQAREVHHATKKQVIAAKDGLHISPATYDVKKRQQSLNNF